MFKKYLAASIVLSLTLFLPAGAAWAQCKLGVPAIKVGVQGAASGPHADYGRQIEMGATMAMEEINRAGGILGCKVQMRFMDDENRPATGVKNARLLVTDWGAHFTVGTDSSGVAMAMGQVLPELKRIHFFTHAATHRLTEDLVNIESVSGNEQAIADAEAGRVDDLLAFLHPRTDLDRRMVEAMRPIVVASVRLDRATRERFGQSFNEYLAAQPQAAMMGAMAGGGLVNLGGAIGPILALQVRESLGISYVLVVFRVREAIQRIAALGLTTEEVLQTLPPKRLQLRLRLRSKVNDPSPGRP